MRICGWSKEVIVIPVQNHLSLVSTIGNLSGYSSKYIMAAQEKSCMIMPAVNRMERAYMVFISSVAIMYPGNRQPNKSTIKSYWFHFSSCNTYSHFWSLFFARIQLSDWSVHRKCALFLCYR